MHTHADKTQENKSQSVAIHESQKQSINESIFQFVDNRPEAVAQRKLQEMANIWLTNPKVSSPRIQTKASDVIQGVFVQDNKVMTTEMKKQIAAMRWNSPKDKNNFIEAFKSEDEIKWDDWFSDDDNNKMNDDDQDSVWELTEQEGAWEDKPEEDSEHVINERANVENRIRSAAKRITKPDNSGHGGGKRIPTGMKGDKHQVGQNRKATRKKALGNNLTNLLEHYAELGGNEKTLKNSTIKLLKKAGWKVIT